jgi:CHAD domain-containing protein
MIAVLQRLHADLTIAMLRVERNPSAAAVHGARVAARRLRSLLRAYRKELHPVLYAGLQFDLGNLARTLAPLREAAVRRHLVRSMRRSASAATSGLTGPGMKALIDELAESERELKTTLRQTIQAAAWTERTQRIDDALSSSALVGVARPSEPDPGHRELQRRIKRVLKHLAEGRISQVGLHRLRLAVKKARYLAEVLPAAPDAAVAPVESRIPDVLRKLQNLLGDLNDWFGLRAWVAAAGMEPAARSFLDREVSLRIDTRLARFRKQRKSLRSSLSEDPSLR